MEKKALQNISVIDLTERIAGQYCTKLLAGFGAEVVKLEPPNRGDAMRTSGPFFASGTHEEASIPFLWLNTGKMSMTLNLDTEKGVEIAGRLIQRADVLVEDHPPGAMSSLGFGYEKLGNLNGKLVMASITNFGQDGPYKNYEAEEIQIQALSGMMFLTGNPEKAPLASGPAICHYSAGLHAYTAILLALFQRGASGRGQHLDISMMESALENIEVALTHYLHTGQKASRGPHPGVPWDLYPCEDGYGLVISMPARHWHRAGEFLGKTDLFDQKYEHILDRIKYRQEYEQLLRSCTKRHKKQDLFRNGQDRGLAFGYVATLRQALESSQHRERDFFVELDHPFGGSHKCCGPPFRMSATPWQTKRAPLLGEHTEYVLEQLLGCSTEQVDRLAKEGVI
jgi:crotonobetainyl-CoA:carnitine CoA-transferase CaiB-like acyl-CoA transferase